MRGKATAAKAEKAEQQVYVISQWCLQKNQRFKKYKKESQKLQEVVRAGRMRSSKREMGGKWEEMHKI